MCSTVSIAVAEKDAAEGLRDGHRSTETPFMIIHDLDTVSTFQRLGTRLHPLSFHSHDPKLEGAARAGLQSVDESNFSGGQGQEQR